MYMHNNPVTIAYTAHYTIQYSEMIQYKYVYTYCEYNIIWLCKPNIHPSLQQRLQ